MKSKPGCPALQQVTLGSEPSFDPEVSLRAALHPETQCRRKHTQCEPGPKGRVEGSEVELPDAGMATDSCNDDIAFNSA